MRRHGLTILELLIVLALLLGVGALVAPAISDRMAARAFESAADEIRSQLLLARLEAMTTRAPLEVVYRSRAMRLEVVRFDPEPGSIQPPADFEDDEVGNPDLAGMESWLDSDSDDNSTAPILIHDLPPGISFHRDRPQESAPGLQFHVADGAGSTAQPLPIDPTDLRVVVFLPDGSVLLAPDCWIVDDAGRTARLSFNRWTGMASVAQIAASDDAAAEAEESPESDKFDIADTGEDEADSDESDRRAGGNEQ